jgi:predicted CXXCH cytochrome family protein
VPFEWLLVALTIALSVRVLAGRDRGFAWLLPAMIVSGAAVALATTSMRQRPLPSPVAQAAAGFGTSTACRSCHPAEYASWHASYHRRMTQRAGTSTVASPQLRQGGRLQVETTGRSVELFGRGAELWARLPDPGVTSVVAADAYEGAFRNAPNRDVRVELLTGSHQHQAFWVAGARAGELRAVPAVYLIAEARLIPRRDAFLNPPHAREQAVRWNSNCIQCHAVAGEPQHDEERDSFASSAAELGIACEACHGAAEAHARAMQNPLTRYRAHGKSEPARGPVDAVTNPAKLPSERASEVCGRCHSYFFPKQEAEWWVHGFARSYRPGQVLGTAQLLLSPEALAQPGAPELGESAESLFYRDGTIRIGGREHNGLVRSPCFERGRGKQQLSCMSCHSLHQSEPADQLGVGKRGNAACASCHDSHAADVSRHSHHAPTSPGSLCYNCHMPHTSYALLGAVRSHRIDSPSFDERTQDRPNACSLCHLERSEAWAASAAAAWYGKRPAFELKRRPELAHDTHPAGAVFALAGDAAVRAIAAAALGRHESGSSRLGLRKQLLEELGRDEYAAVRHVALRSSTSAAAGGAGELSPELVASLKAARDQRPITIAE